MTNFNVGFPTLQNVIEWVDQPPPLQGRDTHTIYFLLSQSVPGGSSPPVHFYHGYMFFAQGTLRPASLEISLA
jgi:hypothetical protein